MQSDLAIKLDVMERVCQNWMDFDRVDRDRNGLATDRQTQIISPPAWPTHGMLTEWVKTLREVRAIVEAKTA